MKKLLMILFEIKGTVQIELIPPGQTLNQAYYVEILKWLREAVRGRRLDCAPSIGFSNMTMLQLTRRSLSSSFCPKNQLLKWNTHPIPLIWLRMTSGCFHKVYLKEKKISEQKTSKKRDVMTALKPVSQEEFRKMFPTVAAFLG
jgi:hypothetical protein